MMIDGGLGSERKSQAKLDFNEVFIQFNDLFMTSKIIVKVNFLVFHMKISSAYAQQMMMTAERTTQQWKIYDWAASLFGWE